MLIDPFIIVQQRIEDLNDPARQKLLLDPPSLKKPIRKSEIPDEQAAERSPEGNNSNPYRKAPNYL